jgi:hypothetical protein
MAYGMNQLTAGLQNAGSTAYDPSTGLTSATAQTPVTGSGDVFSGLAGSGGPPVEVAPELFKAAQSNIDPSFLEGMSASDVAGANVLPSVPNAPAPSFLQQTGANLSSAGQGIKNLSGFGTGTVSEAATKFAAPVTTAGMTALGVGTMGLASLDEQEKALSQQYQQGQVNDTEYNRQMALIADGRRRAEEAVRANPYQFAMGGQVDDELGGDYSAMGMDQGNLQKGLFGMNYAMGGNVSTPRFLSGGGDGMSDSIPARIEGKQEARLADGEFVVPADVVSHLGNGSSKAGAKRLYSMMDRVRHERTGTKKQGKQINPMKYMPA